MNGANAQPTDRKGFFRGTHRIVPPSVTVERWKPHLSSLGITRVADVTGMDCIGIDTVMVIRPNSRSLSVSQGKGIDLDCAKASGIMEAVEQFHAEHIDRPLLSTTLEELTRDRRVIDLARLPRFVKELTPHTRVLWIEGSSLVDGGQRWVPYEIVNLDLTLPLATGSGHFLGGSNGLASGNHAVEAVCHGLCELVERDALTLFFHTPAGLQRVRRLDLTSVPAGPCAELLEKFDRGGIDVAVWNVTSDIGIPAFLCLILERPEECFRVVGEARGSGCHPDPEIALSRALCEAAQSRLTRIVGSRDDLQRAGVSALRSEASRERSRRLIRDRVEGDVAFSSLPSCAAGSLSEDVALVLGRLRDAGLDDAVCVDLTRAGLPGSVVKVLVPGLEALSELPGFRGGERLARHTAQWVVS